MTLQLEDNSYVLILKHSDEGIGASPRENKSCKSNSPEPKTPSVWLNMTSVSTFVVAPKLIRFLVVSMVTTAAISFHRNSGVICSHRIAYIPCQFVHNSGHSHIQQPFFRYNVEQSGGMTSWI